ncbi:polysaccharide deacetylase family protein [Arenibaculum pallidiluteum]|uniref:polysaccharide deacetylase family protein n=1 Tax=Arenibaculum pallidiluteum TaxID=2812559 RepID=UPI001A95E815|nr:polysaccharide deacetylase family protein [Arenibaculum pallidiluteum]
MDALRQALEPAALPPGSTPVLAVIVDTEEEFDWSKPFSRSAVGVASIPAQASMQAVFRRHGIAPTYAIDWPVAATPVSIAFMRRLLDRGECEIGAHLHPWVNPPHEETLSAPNSYAGNLPRELERRKIDALTRLIERNFGRHPRLYKAGRYGIGPQTPGILAELGYEIDASVVPHTSFRGDGGPDFRAGPDRPFWFGPGDRLLELPVSTGFAGRLSARGPALFPWLEGRIGRTLRLPGIAARTGLLERIPLTPEGCGLEDLKRVARAMLADGHRVLTLCYHSPSLVPGHTPYVRDEAQLRAFLATCDAFFDFFASEAGGRFATAAEILDACRAARAAPAGTPEPARLSA